MTPLEQAIAIRDAQLARKLREDARAVPHLSTLLVPIVSKHFAGWRLRGGEHDGWDYFADDVMKAVDAARGRAAE